jgi:dynein light chain LC8-type
MQALEKYNIEKDIAAFIKKEFDKKYNPTWHCIVGRNFGESPDGGDFFREIW